MTSFEAIREFNRGRADDSSIGAEQPFEADGPVGGIAPYADIPEPSQVQFKRRLIVCCSPVDLKHCAAVESAEDQPFRPTGVQPDRKEDSSEQFCREIMLKRSIERSRLLVGYSFATAAREQWPVVLGDHLLQGSDHSHFLGETELRGKGCAIADKGCGLWILIGTDQETMTPIAPDGGEIEVRDKRNPIVPRYLSPPNSNGATNIAPLFWIGRTCTIRLGDRIFQLIAPKSRQKCRVIVEFSFASGGHRTNAVRRHLPAICIRQCSGTRVSDLP